MCDLKGNVMGNPAQAPEPLRVHAHYQYSCRTSSVSVVMCMHPAQSLRSAAPDPLRGRGVRGAVGGEKCLAEAPSRHGNWFMCCVETAVGLAASALRLWYPQALSRLPKQVFQRPPWIS